MPILIFTVYRFILFYFVIFYVYSVIIILSIFLCYKLCFCKLFWGRGFLTIYIDDVDKVVRLCQHPQPHCLHLSWL